MNCNSSVSWTLFDTTDAPWWHREWHYWIFFSACHWCCISSLSRIFPNLLSSGLLGNWLAACEITQKFCSSHSFPFLWFARCFSIKLSKSLQFSKCHVWANKSQSIPSVLQTCISAHEQWWVLYPRKLFGPSFASFW